MMFTTPVHYAVFTAAVIFVTTTAAQAQLRIGDICRLKGQEENTLHGLGLVVGLNGTGDGDALPTTRALAQMMGRLGSPLPQDATGGVALSELKGTRNVALVHVTATVPASGAREGGRLNCQINAIGASSVAGGYLTATAMLGPQADSRQVFGIAQGKIELENADQPATGVVGGGCRLEQSIFNNYVHQGRITLVVDDSHAGWPLVNEIVVQINRRGDFQDPEGDIAKAIDRKNVEVRIPSHYAEDVVAFAAFLMDEKVQVLSREARVVINERAGTIVIGENVTVGPAAVSHKNMVIETGAVAQSPAFVGVDNGAPHNTKLSELVEALNAIKAPTSDVIEIIKTLHRSGSIYGKLILE